jgi:hypothetical protein
MTDTPPAAPVQGDTPIAPKSFPPPSMMDQWKAFIGDLARPFAIYATSGAAALATVAIAFKNDDGFSAAAIFIGAVYAGVGALYAGKAWENVKAGKSAADVEIAKAQAQAGTTP